jgi:hypothetical protein
MAKIDLDHQLKVREYELRNTRLQIEKYQKEINEMSKRVTSYNGPERVLELEEEVRDKLN